MIRVAINGFGRIGRGVLKAGLENKYIKFVAINDLTNTKNLAYLLKYDSTYGKSDLKINSTENSITIDGKKIKVFAEKDPAKLPWGKLGIDVVVESTGFFRTKEKAELHLKAGARKVLISAPAKGDNVITIVPGVNNKALKKTDRIVSNASCTTNCLAPVAKVLNDKFGIEKGMMTTVHAYTADQRLIDSPHSDLRRGRSAAANIVPTLTGAAKAIGLVLPELNGRLDGIAIRVPVIDASVVDLTVELKKEATVDQINKAMKYAAAKELKGVLEYSEEEIVSSDIIGNCHASIFDSKFTKVIGNNAKILAWYDNEHGYCCQVIECIELMK